METLSDQIYKIILQNASLLKGPKGDTGPRGPIGPEGRNGEDGSIAGVTANNNKVLAAPADGSTGAAEFRLLVSADIPALSADKITSGKIALARGGTNADLSATGGAGKVLKQTSVGGDITVGTLAHSELTGSTSSDYHTQYLIKHPTSVERATQTPLEGIPARFVDTTLWTSAIPIDSTSTGKYADHIKLGSFGNGILIELDSLAEDQAIFYVESSIGDKVFIKRGDDDSMWLFASQAQTNSLSVGTGVHANFVTLVAADSATTSYTLYLPPASGSTGKVLGLSAPGQLAWLDNAGGGGGSGTVTSVGLSLPALFSVSNSPVTTTGTLTATLATQSANLVWAGPTGGGAATPTFRALVAADIPTIDHGSQAGLVDDDHTQYIYNAPDSTNRNRIVNATDVPSLIEKAHASQTANIHEIQNSAGTVLAAFNPSGLLYAAAGAVSTPGIAGVSDTNTGIYWVAADSLATTVGGVAAITSTYSASLMTTSVTGAVTITSDAAATVGLNIKGAASQSGNYLEWRNSSNTILGRINGGAIYTNSIIGQSADLVLCGGIYGVFINDSNSSGYLIVGNNYATTGKFRLGYGTDAVQATIKGHSTQTNNLLNFLNNSNTVLASISGSGYLTIGSGSSGGQLTLAANSTTVAQIKMTEGGSLLTSIVNGALEHSTVLYFSCQNERNAVHTVNSYFIDDPGTDFDDWQPNKTATFYEIQNNTTLMTISGMVARHPGAEVTVYNRAQSGENVNLTHQDSNSSVGNRFYCNTGGDITLSPGDMAKLFYSEDQNCWIVKKI